MVGPSSGILPGSRVELVSSQRRRVDIAAKSKKPTVVESRLEHGLSLPRLSWGSKPKVVLPVTGSAPPRELRVAVMFPFSISPCSAWPRLLASGMDRNGPTCLLVDGFLQTVSCLAQ